MTAMKKITTRFETESMKRDAAAKWLAEHDPNWGRKFAERITAGEYRRNIRRLRPGKRERKSK
jgi:hypothetical protein